MSILNTILLAIVQGLTEFLPVSSSGHLVLAGAALDLQSPGIMLEVSLHFGTLLAILAVFGSDVAELARDGWRGLRMLADGRREAIPSEAPRFYTCVALLVGTLPAALAGTMLDDFIRPLFEGNLPACGGFLILTGVVLLSTRLADQGEDRQTGVLKGLGIGAAQALALLPGISRSGMTIAAGLHLNLERENAARFAFLLAIPAMLGAQAWELLGGAGSGLSVRGWMLLGLGAATSAAVGVAALLVLLPLVQRGKLHLFAYYCIPVGAVTAFLGLSGLGGA